jgi:hypothetical protein
MAAYVQVPPHQFLTLAPIGWIRPSATGVPISWDPAPNVIGSVTYSAFLDGRLKAGGLSGLEFTLPARGLGQGIHHVQILATDSAGQHTMSAAAELDIDPNPPLVSLRHLAGGRVEVRVYDTASGARAAGTVISFGDGTLPVRNRLRVSHRYVTPGLYRVTVRCADIVGNAATHHLWVAVR